MVHPSMERITKYVIAYCTRLSILTWKNNLNKQMTKFPYESFPIRIDIKKQNRICWFQHQSHLFKLIERENLKPTEYTISTKGVEIVGKVPGTKSKRVRQGSRRSSKN